MAWAHDDILRAAWHHLPAWRRRKCPAQAANIIANDANGGHSRSIMKHAIASRNRDDEDDDTGKLACRGISALLLPHRGEIVWRKRPAKYLYFKDIDARDIGSRDDGVTRR